MSNPRSLPLIFCTFIGYFNMFLFCNKETYRFQATYLCKEQKNIIFLTTILCHKDTLAKDLIYLGYFPIYYYNFMLCITYNFCWKCCLLSGFQIRIIMQFFAYQVIYGLSLVLAPSLCQWRIEDFLEGRAHHFLVMLNILIICCSVIFIRSKCRAVFVKYRSWYPILLVGGGYSI